MGKALISGFPAENLNTEAGTIARKRPLASRALRAGMEEVTSAARGRSSPLARAHVGIYAFREPFLQEFAVLPPGRLEREESLEQLRALEAGHRIRVVETQYGGFGVDTPEDLERARALLGQAGS